MSYREQYDFWLKDAYFDEKKLFDIQVISTLGLTEDDVRALKKVEGIKKVEYGYSIDALCQANDSQQAVHIMSILPSMNLLTVEEGRLPEKKDECAVDVDYLSASGCFHETPDEGQMHIEFS